ncbi:TetR/AcrR family transcriptional regulator [Amorphoplanes digitatis]|uniref:AcrR family transcriptional regulator n=1 Tax=Actinoplanes digitatis TaxID=1868 RepID=A0A7W7MT00_9ACTN|nr:TetR/AcrR family transcriptional regulator [Actinoplanes digitatis]MBB4765292.1 AcrR family transcriptional regulator [Actinoplanes digitatis]
MDRRVRRTRRMLQEALVALIEERGYERLTVQDVLDRADIGRSTFYTHFRDKDALFMTWFDGLREDLRSEFDAMTDSRQPTAASRPLGVIFDHAYRNQRVYRAVCGRQGGNAFTHLMQRLLFELLREHLCMAGTRLPVEIAAEYYSGALLSTLLWWVRQDFPYQPEELAAMCQLLTAPGVMASLSPAPHIP